MKLPAITGAVLWFAVGCAYDASGIPGDWSAEAPAAQADEPTIDPAELPPDSQVTPEPPQPPVLPPAIEPGSLDFYDSCSADVECATGLCHDFGGATGERCTQACDSSSGPGPGGQDCPGDDFECSGAGVCREDD